MDDRQLASNEIYRQDCEFYRYQDRLKWSRFQTAATIEGAVLWAIFQLRLNGLESRSLMLFGFLLVFILCLLSLKDEVDSNSHEDRIKKFEKQQGQTFAPRKWPYSGTFLMGASVIAVNVSNVIVAISKW